MKKAFFEGLAILLIFFGAWFGLSNINWLHVLHIRQATVTTEEKLGDLFWNLFSKTEKEVRSPAILLPVDSLVTQLCKRNNVDRKMIKLHVLDKDEVNAFALPDNHLVVFTGLIRESENEAELAGVLGHELAHIEKKHVMKKLVKEVGLSVLISMTTGNSGGQVISESARLLSSTAYDRELEREADLQSVSYLLQAGLDPEPFANFLYRLGDDQGELPEQVYWITTHPDSKERAEAIIAALKDKTIQAKPVLAAKTWENLKKKVKEE